MATNSKGKNVKFIRSKGKVIPIRGDKFDDSKTKGKKKLKKGKQSLGKAIGKQAKARATVAGFAKASARKERFQQKAGVLQGIAGLTLAGLGRSQLKAASKFSKASKSASLLSKAGRSKTKLGLAIGALGFLGSAISGSRAKKFERVSKRIKGR